MHQITRLALLAMSICYISWDATASAQTHQFGTRQFYGDWHKHSRGFSYRPYYYKPHEKFVGFKHHYAIHFNARPQHHYFYNPYKKQFWGRCPVATDGKPSYSLLAEKDRSGDINKIPESPFPKPGPMPPIPDSDDGATMDLPPDDLPTIDALPTTQP